MLIEGIKNDKKNGFSRELALGINERRRSLYLDIHWRLIVGSCDCLFDSLIGMWECLRFSTLSELNDIML